MIHFFWIFWILGGPIPVLPPGRPGIMKPLRVFTLLPCIQSTVRSVVWHARVARLHVQQATCKRDRNVSNSGRMGPNSNFQLLTGVPSGSWELLALSMWSSGGFDSAGGPGDRSQNARWTLRALWVHTSSPPPISSRRREEKETGRKREKHKNRAKQKST